MCPRCYVGFPVVKNNSSPLLDYHKERLLVPLKLQEFCGFIPRQFKSTSSQFERLRSDIWLLIILYAGQYDLIHRIAQCNHSLHRYSLRLWSKLCVSLGEKFPYLKVETLNDYFFISPGFELPDSWKKHFVVCCRKLELVKSMQRKEQDFSKFYQTFKKLKNLSFGNRRKFSSTCVYFLMSNFKVEEFPNTQDSTPLNEDLYDFIEFIEINSQNEYNHIDNLHRKDISISMHHLSLDNESCITGTGIGTVKVSSSLVRYCSISLCKIDLIPRNISCFTSGTGTDHDTFISYADIAMVLIDLCKSSNKKSENIYLRAFAPRLVMPFEAYHVELH